MIRVAVAGAAGRMGSEVVRAVTAAEGLEVVAQIEVGEDLAAILAQTKPQVMVDFTVPEAAMPNIRIALSAGVVPVVGTTGLTPEDLAELRTRSARTGTACFVAPNFAIGAVLMMQFATLAARHFPDVEILEMHHEKKVDAPSGTAVKTAQMVAAARDGRPAPEPAGAFESHAGARGGSVEGIRVHSVRLPGFVASQEVIFGGPGQRLSLRHDSMDRASFMPGVLLAVRRAPTLAGLVYGLENLL